MSTISFKKQTGEAPPTPEAPASVGNGLTREDNSKALATRGERQVGFAANSQFSGNWNYKDVRLPRINLIHKTSSNELIKKFGIGAFAFNKEIKLSDGETPVVITALRAAKDYVQKLPYGSPQMPAVFDTPQDVIDNGGSFDNKDRDSGNFFMDRAHIQFVVAAPEGIDESELALFPYEFGGKQYACALLTVASSAYTSVGKELATLCNNNKVMRKGMEFGALNLTSEGRKNAKNDWLIPVIKFAGENPAELVEFYRGLQANS